MSRLDKDVQYIKGIGEKRAASLSKLGIATLGDLVSYFPRAYEDRSVMRSIGSLMPGELACIKATVSAPPRAHHVRTGMDLLKFRVFDDTGSVEITYFNQKYLKDRFKQGETCVFYGKFMGLPRRLTLANPVFEEPEAAFSTGRIVPIYRLTAGISQKTLMTSIRSGLDACIDQLPDPLPDGIRELHRLSHAGFAYENIHFPESLEALELSRRRFIFQELFLLVCAMRLLRDSRDQEGGIRFQLHDFEAFYETLPFRPTNAQLRAVNEAAEDLESGKLMSRLTQGDVGSGKTLVAAALIWLTWKNGYQSAFMAPTEILAKQHFDTLSGFLEPLGVRVILLTGSMTAKQKREAKGHLALGEADLVIGTHALLSDDVEFSDLALVVTDEQHRFGVSQRSALSGKGERPHVLVMSATPIPRTLALIIYGDLDVSVLDELPPGRQKVDTFAVDESYRQRLNNFIRRLVAEGRQVFIVCPMIEENEEFDPGQELKSAQVYAGELQEQVFPDLRVGCIHGKMKQGPKDRVMSQFVAHELDILVATTVIEVGVDIPNAALMIIENANRFGLSQLHQLRGRVGRGEHKSYCILVSGVQSEEVKARLGAMCKTSDGFKISEEDLKLRGPGDFFGSRQHGLPQLHIADLQADMDILKAAQTAAEELLNADPRLEEPENRVLLAHIKELFREQGDIFS